MTESPPLLMTLQEVANLLGVSLSTVRRAMDSGALQSTRPGPKVLRFTRAQVDAWLKKSVVCPSKKTVALNPIEVANLAPRA